VVGHGRNFVFARVFVSLFVKKEKKNPLKKLPAFLCGLYRFPKASFFPFRCVVVWPPVRFVADANNTMEKVGFFYFT